MPVAHTRLNRVQRDETYAGYCDIYLTTCPTCGVLHGIPNDLDDEARRLGEHKIEIMCPNGHVWGYAKGEEARLREQLERERTRAGRLAAARDQAEAQVRAERAAKTRIKNSRDRERKRVAGGVCPCCNRTFKQLARHMKSQHPDYAEAE